MKELDSGNNLKGLTKVSEFVDNPYGIFFSNPSFSWLNPATINPFNPGSSTKVPVHMNVESVEEIIQVWDRSIDNDKNWFISENNLNCPQGRAVSYTVNSFNMFDGLPLIIGHVYQIKPLS